jgi:hypothetical protein
MSVKLICRGESSLMKNLIFVIFLCLIALFIISCDDETCWVCGGSGRCPNCGGKGYIKVDTNICYVCKGSGKCVNCQGKGKIKNGSIYSINHNIEIVNVEIIMTENYL